MAKTVQEAKAKTPLVPLDYLKAEILIDTLADTLAKREAETLADTSRKVEAETVVYTLADTLREAKDERRWALNIWRHTS